MERTAVVIRGFATLEHVHAYARSRRFCWKQRSYICLLIEHQPKRGFGVYRGKHRTDLSIRYATIRLQLNRLNEWGRCSRGNAGAGERNTLGTTDGWMIVVTAT